MPSPNALVVFVGWVRTRGVHAVTEALVAAGVDVRAVDVDVPGRGAGPGVTKQFLDGEQAHPREVELGSAEVPQHMRCELARPGWQVAGGGLGQRPAEHIGGRP